MLLIRFVVFLKLLLLEFDASMVSLVVLEPVVVCGPVLPGWLLEFELGAAAAGIFCGDQDC